MFNESDYVQRHKTRKQFSPAVLKNAIFPYNAFGVGSLVACTRKRKI